MNVTLRQLEYFVAIAADRSFQRAARACGVSQPGLSAQLRQLEDHLDTQLFERDRRQVLLTDVGAELLGWAQGILRDVRELEDAAQGHAKPLCGELRLGVIPTVAPYLLPRVLPPVREQYPELRLLLREEQTRRLVELLWVGQLDLLLLALEAPLNGLETESLFSDPFLLAMGRGHRLAGRKRIRESELEDETVMLLDDGHCLRDQALAVCASTGATEVGDFRATSLCTLIQMVASGESVTLLPELAREFEAGDALALVPFAKPSPTRTIGLAWRPSTPRADDFRAFGEVIRTELN